MRFLSWNLFKGFVKWKIKPNISSNKFTKCYMTYSHLKCHKSCPFLLKTHEGFTFVKNWVSVALSDIQIHVPGKSKILIYGHKKTDMVYTLAFTNSKKIIFCINKIFYSYTQYALKTLPPSFICPVCSYRWLHLLNWMTGVKLQFFFD